MSQQAVVYKNFEGGWSVDGKVGLPHSFSYARGIDFRKAPSQLSLLPQPVKEGNGVVNDLIQNAVIASSGDMYLLGSTGNLYRRVVGTGEYRILGNTGTATFGMDYRADSHAIYFTGRKHVHWLDGTTSLVINPQHFGPSASTYNNTPNTGFNVSALQDGSNQTTTLGTSIIEKQPNTRYFQTDIEPLYGVALHIINRGTGDWTITVHDGNNAVLASSTFLNASLTNGLFNLLTFPSATNGQVRLYPAPNARTYHVHITSTVADGTVASSSANDLSTADLQIYADRLIYADIHPIERFQQFECIGNANYLSVWEPISDPPTNVEWVRHKLTFPQEYQVIGLAAMNEYLAVACEKAFTNSEGNVVAEDGIIFFWDGLSDTYNYYVRIPEGAPMGIHEHQNVVYYYAGGDWYGIASGSTTPVKIRNMPGSGPNFITGHPVTRMYPNSAAVRNGIHLMAYPSTTNYTAINYGVYSYGQVDKNFPQSFGYNYVMSTGSQNKNNTNNLQLGMLKSFDDMLLFSWRDDDNGGYGIDRVDALSAPASTFSWESNRFDNGLPTKIKTALHVKVSFQTLPSGITITPKYKINRGSWVLGDAFSNTSLYMSRTDYCRLDIPQGDFTEIEIGFDGTCTGSTTPVITAVTLGFEDNADQGID